MNNEHGEEKDQRTGDHLSNQTAGMCENGSRNRAIGVASLVRQVCCLLDQQYRSNSLTDRRLLLLAKLLVSIHVVWREILDYAAIAVDSVINFSGRVLPDNGIFRYDP
jgi:hypothetical protein